MFIISFNVVSTLYSQTDNSKFSLLTDNNKALNVKFSVDSLPAFISNNEKDNFSISWIKNNLIINFNKPEINKGILYIYSLNGQLLTAPYEIRNGSNRLNLTSVKGLYIIRLVTSQSICQKKVIFN